MTSVFQVLAADTSEQQNTLRVATRIAHKRATETFGDFIKGGDRAERLDLVADELADLVTATCNEYGIVNDHVLAGIRSSLLGSEPDNLEARTASVHESRRPKLCPYHKEVTDISLAQGEPRAGFDAMAQHAWGAHHCQGSEYEGKCNFKPAMTTQGYWDEKAEKAQERREQREQENAQIEQDLVEPDQPLEETLDAEPAVETETDLPDNVIEVDFTPDAAEVINQGAEADAPLDAVAASVDDSSPLGKQSDRYDTGLMLDNDPYHGIAPNDEEENDHLLETRACPNCGGAIQLHDFDIAAGNEEIVCPSCRTAIPNPAVKDIREDLNAVPTHYRGANKVAEALKTVDVDGTEGPVPEIDKRTWTPENLEQRVDTEGEGSPHPTRDKDLLDAADYSNDDISAETDAVLEKQDVEKDSNPSSKGDHTDTFSGDGQANPVSSAVDVERNPIREVLLEDDGFLSQTEVTAAISATR